MAAVQQTVLDEELQRLDRRIEQLLASAAAQMEGSIAKPEETIR